MTDPNLPPGTTAQDIDDHFGGESKNFSVGLTIKADVAVRATDGNKAVAKAREEIGAADLPDSVEIVEIEPEFTERI